MAKPFRVGEREIGDGLRVIDVEGELDLAVVDQLQATIDRRSASKTVFSLSECEFIDSSGVAAILLARSRAAEEGRRVALCCAEDQVEHLLSMMGLTADDGFVFATLDDAVSALAGV